MKTLIGFLFCIFATSLQAADEIDISNLSLEDLLNLKTSVASKSEKTSRESPGIVTVITKEEMHQMGARDLIDVLQMVPGIQFGTDVQGVVGLAIRGHWANEGKFSLMVDGQEMNEILYSTAQFGNHYPVDHIKQIEIIRGPGSAIYGGYAELAVIHVITEKGADINGAKAVITYGQMREDFGRRNLSVQVGKKIGEWDYSLAGLIGQGRRGDGSFTGFKDADTPPPNYLSETYDYSQGRANDLNPGWLNFGANNGKWDLRLIYDNYRTTSRTLYGYTFGLPTGLSTSYESIYASLKYDYKLNESWTLTPYINLRHQSPWKITDSRAVSIAQSSVFDITVQRSRAGFSTQYSYSPQTLLLFGAEIYQDQGKINNYSFDLVTQETFAMTGNNEIDFDGLAAYSQLELDLDFFEITLGGRWEQLTTPTGRKVSKTVPRFAVTKAEEKWHVKGLASQAYRTPSIFNFDADFAQNSASLIKPETTTTFELEGGFATSKTSYFTMNLFSVEIADAIIYATDGNNDFYNNFPKVQTMGVEMEYKKKNKWGFTNLNYSFYERGTNTIPTYAVPGKKELLGIPQHKITYLNSFKTKFSKKMTVAPSIVYMSSKYSYELDVSNDAKVLRELPAVTLINLYVSYPDLFLKGLELGAGVFNLFDEENRFVQPYDGDIGNIPAPSREFVARLSYSLNF